jgi:hypothetical protein
MKRKTRTFFPIVISMAALAGCSNNQSSVESKKAAAALDKIQGKALITGEATATDAALNAGGPSVYLVDDMHRFRLFFNTAVKVIAGKEYAAEGVNAQKVIDDLGDPEQGKNGYPLESSCERAVRMAWSNLPFDVFDGKVSVLRARVKRYPARAVFLVTRLDPVGESTASKNDSPEKDNSVPEISVPAEKQRASLIEGPTTQTAPLWEPAGGTVLCKVVIGPDGKVSELGTGMQLCEAVPWSQFRYQPPVQNGHAVKVKTEVEIRFEPRK